MASLSNRDYLIRLWLACLLPLLAATTQWQLREFLPPYPWLLLYPAVFFSAWLAGSLGGLLATSIALPLGVYLFVPLHLLWEAKDYRYYYAIAIFGLMGLLFSLLHGRIQRLQTDLQASTEQNLDSLQHKLAMLLDTVHAGLWRWQVNSKGIFCSGSVLRLHNLPAAKPQLSLRSWLRCVHPKQRAAAMQTVKTALVTQRHFELEYCVVEDSSAATRWLLLQGEPVVDNMGFIQEFNGVVLDITQRKRAELAKQAKEMEFNQLAEAMPQIVWVTRADGWNIYFNQQWVDYTGLSLAESYGHGWNTPFHPDDQKRAWDAWQNAVRHRETYSLECQLRRADGEYRWWLVRGVPVFNAAGQISKWFGTCTDIHDIKLTEARLRESEFRWQFAVDGNNQGLWDWDLISNTVFFSKRLKSMLGFGEDEISNRLEEWSERVHPDDWSTTLADVQQHLAGATEYYQNEHRLRNKQGEYQWILDRGVVVSRDAAGQATRMIGTHTDITEQKLILDALRDNERFLADSQAIAHIGSWMLEIENKRMIWSDEIFNLLGFATNQTTMPTLEQIYTLIYPDDLEHFKSWMHNCLNVQDPDGLEFRIQPHANPQKREWLYIVGKLETGVATQADRIIGTLQNVTERIQLQKLLHESHERLQLFVKHAPAAIAIFDRDMRYIAYSHRWLDDYQLGELNLVGQSHYDIFPEIPFHWKGIHLRGLGGETIRCEVDKFQRSNGTKHYLQWEVRPWYTNENLVGGIAIFTEDITARVQTQSQLHLLGAALEASANAILITDSSGNIEWINQGFTQMTGYSLSDTQHKNYRDLIRTQEGLISYETMLQTVMTGEVWRGEILNQHITGGEYLVEQVVTPVLNQAGQVAHLIAIKQDISQRKQMEAELHGTLVKYQELSSHLESIREEERIRIAREIHDELGGFLTALKIDLSLLAKDIPDELLICHDKVKLMKEDIRQGLKTIKRIINDLRPSVLDHLGLLPAIDWLADNLLRRSNINWIKTFPEQEVNLPAELNTAVFRITQEAFVNVVRHANASLVRLTIALDEQALVISIADNGIGIDPKMIDQHKSFGIQGMYARVNYFKGTIALSSPRSGGTTIKIRIPLQPHLEQLSL